MGGGIKSKFRLPMSGRSSTKQQVPVVSVSGPLSKAQRILGADGINTGSSRLTVEPGRSWETGSTSGVSVSISESSASQATHDTGFDREDVRNTLWEEESAIIPRQIRSAHGTSQRSVAKKRSTFTLRNESRENVAKAHPRGRRLSSSTIDTHYDPANMPLAISQQTSNSAMAKGLPTKVNELLDVDGTLGGTQTGKKKPAKLDLSRLRPKVFRDRNKHASHVDPMAMNAMRSPSVMSQRTDSRTLPSPASEGQQKTPRKLMKNQFITRQSPRSRGITDTTGLHQLYHHYEQMSFQDDEVSDEQIDQEHTSAHSGRNANKLRPASAFTHSLIAPLQLPALNGQEETRGHSRTNSHDSRVTVSVADSSGGLHAHSTSTKDYAGSVSSRHTRTSKASPSNRSLVESDRLQSSVLSLSDSSDDEAVAPAPPAPVSRRESVMRDAAPENSSASRSQQGSTYMHGTISPRKFKPSLNQVDEHLATKSTARTRNSRSPSNNPSHQGHSSVSTLTSVHQLPSAPDSRLSMKSTKTADTPRSSQQSGYEVQQARAVSLVPLASTAKAASHVAIPEGVHSPDKVLLRQNSSASHFSHSTDQPTPPLSPNSVEFYIKSRDSLQRDAMTSGSTEAHNARLMAVTRQEEMLLAALRQKRAKMREIVISEGEEEGNGRMSRSGRDSSGNMQKSAMPKRRVESTSTPWPKRASSLFMAFSRENLRGVEPHTSYRKEPHDVDIPSATSRSDRAESTSTPATGSTTSLAFDSRDDRFPLYLDQPTESLHTPASGVDFGDDYLDDSDGEDLIANERRTSRRESRRHSPASATQGYRTSSTSSHRESSSHSGRQYRAESNPGNLPIAPVNGDRLQDVPEVEVEVEVEVDAQSDYNEDVDADDDDLEDDTIDDFPQPPMPPPSWPLPPRPEKLPTTPNRSPASATFLHPSSAMMQSQSPESKAQDLKAKRSIVRLSAVGHGRSPVPYWGDDD
ncbi:hypothetical protein F5Y14DRAFT_255398 [Nemania sp. NC0429]|nr:hypothetical protein F5Y14DRAFT_255398 [Nemania sp. NC0429]